MADHLRVLILFLGMHTRVTSVIPHRHYSGISINALQQQYVPSSARVQPPPASLSSAVDFLWHASPERYRSFTCPRFYSSTLIRPSAASRTVSNHLHLDGLLVLSLMMKPSLGLLGPR